MTPSVLICHDIRFVADALHGTFVTDARFRSVTIAATVAEASARIQRIEPSVVVLAGDARRWNAAAAISELRQVDGDIRVVALDMRRGSGISLLAGGAWGCLPPSASAERIVDGAWDVACGQRLPSSVLDETGDAVTPRRSDIDLSEREQQVLSLLAEGQTNSQIGRSLYVSEDTVKTHARRLFRKLDVNDRAHAVATGMRHGLLY